MTQKTEIEELQALHRKSQSLRQQREGSVAEIVSDSSQENGENPDPGVIGESHAEPDLEMEGLTSQVETLLADLEDAAAEHPGLALLAAFGIGIAVGQLLSRR